MSLRRRQLQDESARIRVEIEQLRSLEQLDETAEGRLNDLAKRADEIGDALLREDDLDAKLAKLSARPAGTAGAAEPRAADEGEKPFEVPRLGARNVFSTAKAAAMVSGYLRAIYKGEVRAMGETSPAYDAKGAEYVIQQLYGAVVNRLQYKSLALQLGTVVTPDGARIDFPKCGELTAAFVAEGVAATDEDLSTSVAPLTLYEARRGVPVSRALLEDSNIDVGSLVVERLTTAFAKLFDATWLGGSASSPSITGLAASVAAGNTITVAAASATTLNNLADVVGKVDESIMGSGVWVASRAGYVDLMKLWAAQPTTTPVGNGRMLPTIMGAPVYLAKGLPSTTLALFGDFSMASAVGVKRDGIEIEVGREILMRNRQVLYVGGTRYGVANHGPEFIGRLAKAAS